MIIDLGSGPHPKPDANICVDFHPWPRVNVQHDLRVLPYPFADNMADKIYFGDVIEHLDKFIVPAVLKDILRILKPDGILDVTCPDIRWVCERIANNDWAEHANVDWLNPTPDPFENAMSYVFGGWMTESEYKIPGMGHINGFDEAKLKRMLLEAGFKTAVRVDDTRNPAPARNSILRMLATK